VIQKGKISSIESTPTDTQDNETTARVIPSTGNEIVTRPLVIPWRLRGKGGNLAPGVSVVFIVFDDFTGYIIDRADGEFSGDVYGDFILHGGKNNDKTVTTTIKTSDDTITLKVGTEYIQGGDLKTDRVASYNVHTHAYTHGGLASGGDNTTPPQ
jgi:hypothetical protein